MFRWTPRKGARTSRTLSRSGADIGEVLGDPVIEA
jgi:hypothetical protein